MVSIHEMLNFYSKLIPRSKKWGRLVYIWVFPKIGGAPKWMVYNGKPYKNGWFGGTTIFGNIHIYQSSPIFQRQTLLASIQPPTTKSIEVYDSSPLEDRSQLSIRFSGGIRLKQRFFFSNFHPRNLRYSNITWNYPPQQATVTTRVDSIFSRESL